MSKTNEQSWQFRDGPRLKNERDVLRKPALEIPNRPKIPEREQPALPEADTVPANELVAQIHDRMLAILPNDRFARWLSDEADPRELLVPFPADELAVSAQRSRR
jgi:hypothetical protein